MGLRLFRRGDHDFDEQVGSCELGAHAGPGRHVLRIDPGVPHFVEPAEIGEIGDPQIGRQDLRLVGADRSELGVDIVQDLLGLGLDVAADLAALSGELDRIAVHDDSAHRRHLSAVHHLSGSGLVPFDCHVRPLVMVMDCALG